MLESDIAEIAHWMLRVPLWQRYGLSVETITALFHQAISNQELLIVIEVENSEGVAGFAWCVSDGAFARSPYLKQIGVHPEFTSMGIGGLLLDYIEATSQQHSKDLFLLVSDFNKAAQKFYERHGYQQIGMIPAYVLPDVTELIYYKRLVG
jgi:ribosomal protein S18 acetylase RimI-like enzyme